LHGKGIINNYSKSKTNKFLYNFVFNSSYVISLSKKLLLDLEFIKSKKKFIVNNGIDNLINPNLNKNNNDKIQILFLSNLLISKGIMTFLESIALLQKENKIDSNLYYVTIIGRNAEITSVEINDFIKKNNLININYLGPKYEGDKEKILNEKSILVFPSKNDAFPLVILEAMKYGIPVISSDEGGISDIIIEEKTGFIIADINAEKIVNKVKYLIESPEKFDQMSENSIECFNSKFSLESFENNMIKVFSEILKY
jgi:glycosyltransferase involved in cell wall biosynthesis